MRSSLFDELKALGWNLERAGWKKYGWCFIDPRHALAVDYAFLRLPYREAATFEEVKKAQRAVENAL